MNRLLILILVSSLTGGLLVGCTDDRPLLVPVSGKVTKDGRPVTAGSITFHPSASNDFTADNPSSLLQLDGRFTMKTFPYGEGMAIGQYTVTVAPEVAQRYGLPRYASRDDSPWQVTVTETGIEDLELKIE